MKPLQGKLSWSSPSNPPREQCSQAGAVDATSRAGKSGCRFCRMAEESNSVNKFRILPQSAQLISV